MYFEKEREELRREGITLLSVKGSPTPRIEKHEAWRIAEECLLRLGFPRYVGPVHLPLVRIRERRRGVGGAPAEHVCWIARATTRDVRGPLHRAVLPTYQRVGVVLVDADSGEVHLSKAWERRNTESPK